MSDTRKQQDSFISETEMVTPSQKCDECGAHFGIHMKACSQWVSCKECGFVGQGSHQADCSHFRQQSSDTRKQIAERHASIDGEGKFYWRKDDCLAAMSEYAAAVLEEAAKLFAPDDDSADTACYGYEVRLWLEQRAAQERAR